MHALLGMLTRFISMSSRATRVGGSMSQTLGLMSRSTKFLGLSLLGVAGIMGGAFLGAMSKVVGVFSSMITEAIGFDLSLKGLMDQAEKTRRYFSELADEMNFYSSSTGSTKNAMGLLLDATGKSKAGLQTLKGAFEGLVNAGVDTDDAIKDMLPTLGDFEVKTGVAASQFALLTGKFQQMFNEKKGITNDIKKLQEAMIGTGLKGSQLEQTMQGLTEVSEKLAFATNGDTLQIKKLGVEYSKTVATFKAFGVSAQTTTTFLNGMLDPENVEKNMLLMNKLGISYGDFNDMLNSGKGQEKFFDKILNNIGDVAKEASGIQDASTRYKYLKDTLNLPPEIANKLMKVAPHRMQSELRRIKKEMEEAEKKEKWRKDLKAREEKYEEQMNFLRMQMVGPLVDLISKNRGTMGNFMKALVPIIQGLSRMAGKFLTPFIEWLDAFSQGIDKLKSADTNTIMKFATDSLGPLWESIKKSFSDVWNSNEMQSAIIPFIETIGKHMSSAVSFVVHKATGGKWFGKDKTYKDFLNEQDKQEEEKKAENKTKGNNSINTLASQNIKNKNLRDKVNFRVGPGRYDTTLGARQRAMESMINDIRKLDVSKPIDDKTLQELKKNNSSFKNFDLNDLTEMVNNVKDYKTQNAKALERFNSLNGAETFQESQAFVANLENNQKANIDRNAALQKMKNGGSTLGLNPNAKVSDQTKKDADTVNNSINSGTASVGELAKTILNNKELKEQITGVVAANAKTQIDTLSNELSAKTNQITDLQKKMEDISKELEGLKENTTVGLLTDIKFGFFGPQGNNQLSIKKILLGILEAVDEEVQLTEKEIKLSKSGKTAGVKNVDNELINQSASSSILSGQVSQSSVIKSAMGENVKNIQVKQTLFLKSIAESTYDSANILKYIGKNLIFTQEGLAVKTGIDIGDDKLTTITGASAGASNLFGFAGL